MVKDYKKSVCSLPQLVLKIIFKRVSGDPRKDFLSKR